MSIIAQANLVTFQEKPWESSLFGLPVYNLILNPEIDGVSLREAIQGLGQPRAMLTARIPATALSTVRALEEAEFHLMECYLTLRHSLQNVPPGLDGNIEPASDTDIPSLRTIAEKAFQYSRFHMDPDIPKETAALTRSEWVANAAASADKTVLVAKVGSRVAGFVTIKIKSQTQIGVLDLIAVDPDFQGQGLGLALTRACLGYCLEQGCQNVEVGTQAHNIASLRMYETAGFMMAGAAYSYHKHL